MLALFLSIVALESADPAANSAPEMLARLQRLGTRQIRLHDPSTIVRDEDDYWLFSTGRGVSSFRSKDLEQWLSGPPVFTNSPTWVAEAVPENRRMHFWAPDVIKLGGEYFLYYSVSSFGKNKSAIALARTPTLDPSSANFGWKDHGIVIQSERTNDFNAIDPALTLDTSGRLWMSFGSFWTGIKLVELDRASGMRISTNSPIHSLARQEAIEAPFIHHHEGFYYLFVNWGICCRGTNSTYNMRVGRSKEIIGPYADHDGKEMMQGGGTLLLETDGPFIGPGHPGILKAGDRYLMSMHFYDANRRGASTLAIRPLQWDGDGWPSIVKSE